jgi:hypothetical protein
VKLVALIALAAAACAPDIPDKPRAPDMSALVAAYRTPTAPLDQVTGDELIGRVVDRLELTDALGALEGVVDDVLDPAIAEGEPAEEGGAVARKTGGNRNVTTEGDGYLQIRHVCRGFGAMPPVARLANGALEATVGFTEAGLDPVVWGTFTTRESVIGDREVLIDGVLEIYLGESLQVDHFGDSPLLFSLAAEVAVDGETMAAPAFDFQVCPRGASDCPGGTLEILVATPGGEHMTFFLDPGRSTGGFRASNGLWSCDLDEAGATCRQDGAEPVVLVGLSAEAP